MATVILDFEQAGATAATLLLKAIGDRSVRPSVVLLPAEFDPRGSTAPPIGRCVRQVSDVAEN